MKTSTARSLSVREKVLDPDNVVLGPANNNLATPYHQLGRYADAEAHYKRALAIWEKSPGPDHPDVGTALFNLGSAYRLQSKFADAEISYRRGVEITIQRSGRGNDAIGQALTWSRAKRQEHGGGSRNGSRSPGSRANVKVLG